jgi:hypothetical protein
MTNWLRSSWRFLRRSSLWLIDRRPTYRAEFMNELPERLRPNILYAIGERVPWSAALLCPCGCGSVIQLSLLKKDSPCWALVFRKRLVPTLIPSIQRTTGCCSHFFLREGRVIWCPRAALSESRAIAESGTAERSRIRM